MYNYRRAETRSGRCCHAPVGNALQGVADDQGRMRALHCRQEEASFAVRGVDEGRRREQSRRGRGLDDDDVEGGEEGHVELGEQGILGVHLGRATTAAPQA